MMEGKHSERARGALGGSILAQALGYGGHLTSRAYHVTRLRLGVPRRVRFFELFRRPRTFAFGFLFVR